MYKKEFKLQIIIDTKPHFDCFNDVLDIIKNMWKEPTILHIDLDSVSASISYNEFIDNNYIKISMSRAKKTTGYLVNESLKGWIKEE